MLLVGKYSKNTYTLGNELGKGGEGAVYEIRGHPEWVAKIYHKERRTPDRFQKLEIMIQHPPKNPTESQGHPSFTWPKEILLENGSPVGYIMPRIKNMEPILKLMSKKEIEIFINKNLNKNRISKDSYIKFIIRVAYNICATISEIHKAKYVIGDINEQNIMVNEKALITIIDTDSFQVKDDKTQKIYPCPVGKPEYTHPEILKQLLNSQKSFAHIIKDPYHDNYNLAVIIFRLLMNGFFPFNGVPPIGQEVSIEERIIGGIFPFGGSPKGWKRPPSAPRYEERTSRELRQLFTKAFVESTHNPTVCPPAEHLANALERMENEYSKKALLFYSLKGAKFKLGNKLYEGGDGNIYEIGGDPSKVAKVYHEHRRFPKHFQKLEIMVRNPPQNPTERWNHPSFIWPEDILLENDTPIGYIMPRLKEDMEPLRRLMKKNYLNEFIRKNAISHAPNKFLIKVACNICGLVNYIHKIGYIIGDLNDKNVLINRRALVTISYTESFQVKDPQTGKIYSTNGHKPEYIHPEILRQLVSTKKRLTDIIQHPYHDNYNLAVIVFRLLMDGFLPFDGIPPAGGEISTEDRILKGIFPFAKQPAGWLPPYEAPSYEERVSEELRKLFWAAFVESTHNPKACPSADQFAAALEKMQKG